MPERVGTHKLLNFASQIDDNTIAQAIATASLPFVHPHVALMPDAHSGKGSAVGTVIPTRGAVIPAAVGVDIGCGMIAVQTRLHAAAIGFGGGHTTPEGNHIPERQLSELRYAIEDAIPVSPGVYNAGFDDWPFTRARIDALQDLARRDGVDLTHSPKWREQLGSLGGGNHFIEVCLDEDDCIWLFLHSGSRGVGNKIAQRHIKIARALMEQWMIPLADPDLAYLPSGTDEFGNYLRELHWAQRFAYENRAEMMDRLRWVFAEWAGYVGERSDCLEVERIQCHHNYTVQENHGGQDVWLTRKGAINAHEGVRGLIPGSMGTKSYVVTGKGNTGGLCSAPHGAGRRFSRTEAKRRYTEHDLATAMEGIEYRHGAEWIDEIPQAYKPIDVVMADAADLVSIDRTLRQILNVKGT